MKKIIIFGANSEIVLSTCRHLLDKNSKITLIGKNKQKIENNYKNYNNLIDKIYEVDLSDLKSINNLFENNLDPINFDLVIICQGKLEYEEENFNSIENIFKVNTLSIILIVNLFLKIKKKNLQISVLSSVAGDRLRQSNYIYGMTKNCLNEFSTIILNRKYKSIIYQNIKPGIIKTKMTKNINSPISTSSDLCGKHICKIINTKKNGNFYVPSYWKLIMYIIRILPNIIFKKIK